MLSVSPIILSSSVCCGTMLCINRMIYSYWGQWVQLHYDDHYSTAYNNILLLSLSALHLCTAHVCVCVRACVRGCVCLSERIE